MFFADDDPWPTDKITWDDTYETDKNIHTSLKFDVLVAKPITGIQEDKTYIHFPGLQLQKTLPSVRLGFWTNLSPTSHFYKRPINFPDLGIQGWAIIFQLNQPTKADPPVERFVGWMPFDNRLLADQIIGYVNDVIANHVEKMALDRSK